MALGGVGTRRPVGRGLLAAVREAVSDDLNTPAVLEVVDAWADATLVGVGDDAAAPALMARRSTPCWASASRKCANTVPPVYMCIEPALEGAPECHGQPGTATGGSASTGCGARAGETQRPTRLRDVWSPNSPVAFDTEATR